MFVPNDPHPPSAPSPAPAGEGRPCPHNNVLARPHPSPLPRGEGASNKCIGRKCAATGCNTPPVMAEFAPVTNASAASVLWRGRWPPWQVSENPLPVSRAAGAGSEDPRPTGRPAPNARIRSITVLLLYHLGAAAPCHRRFRRACWRWYFRQFFWVSVRPWGFRSSTSRSSHWS
jgi:hypothetical protein